MDCPQCGAVVPSENAFCGRCGYAMRDHTLERKDQSRIRVHEEPPPRRERENPQSSPKTRQKTMLGMPAVGDGAVEVPVVPETPPPAPPPSPARATRRAQQKTMLGIPRLELPDAPPGEHPDSPATPVPIIDDDSGTSAHPPARERAHAQYDTLQEPPAVVMRRRRAFRLVGALVVVAAAWLVYRILNG